MATALTAYETSRFAPRLTQMHRSGVSDILRTYRPHLRTFLITASVILAASGAYAALQVPRYTASAALVIAPRPAEIGADRTTPLSDPAASASVDTQVELLKNRGLAGVVVDRLHLADAAPYRRLMDEPRLKIWPTQTPEQDTTQATRREQAIERLVRGLDVNRTAQTFALALSFSHADRRLAADIVNTFADQFVRQSLAVKRQGAGSAYALLRGQLAGAQTEVEAADAALGNYKVAHRLMSVQGGTIAEQQLSAMEQQTALARADEAAATAHLDTARRQLASGSAGDDLGEALGSPVIQQLRSQRAVVSGQVADLSSHYRPQFPRLLAAQHQLVDIDTQIQGEITRTISNLEAQRDVSARRTASLAGSVAAAAGAVSQNNIASVKLGGLQLRSDTAHASYGQLMGRMNEIVSQDAAAQPDARILSLSPVPVKPSAPNIPVIMLIGVLLAMAGGLGVVFLRQETDQGIGSLEDVEGKLRLPYLAGLPTLASSVREPKGSDPITALLDHRESAYAEGFRTLAAAVIDGADAGIIRTVALTSALPNEGKTTAAIGLARMMAMSGRKVVLVDADMRRPSVANALGLRPAVGLQHVLDGDVTAAEALIWDEASGAAILPMLRSGDMSSASLNNGGLEGLIETLKATFDVIIFDASPVLPVVDGRLVAKKADATVLLVRWRKTPDAAVEMAIGMLRALGVAMTGIALTRVDLDVLARTGYDDPARFMGAYASYYSN